MVVVLGLFFSNTVCSRGQECAQEREMLQAWLDNYYADDAVHESDVYPIKLPERSGLRPLAIDTLDKDLVRVGRWPLAVEQSEIGPRPVYGMGEDAQPKNRRAVVVAVEATATISSTLLVLRGIRQQRLDRATFAAKVRSKQTFDRVFPKHPLGGFGYAQDASRIAKKCPAIDVEIPQIAAPDDAREFIRGNWATGMEKCACTVSARDIQELRYSHDGALLGGADVQLDDRFFDRLASANQSRIFWDWLDSEIGNPPEGFGAVTDREPSTEVE